MVKIERVNKYFNKRKKNEIHVINNTSLKMEEQGLIALLGPSGCGKTTLLNVIGGLDKINGGKVFINGQRITGKRAGTVDRVRNMNVGYIFQNYNLVDNMSVFDNVAIALQMLGVKDKKEIEEKVNYVLEKVGMYRYRNRYADMLSGGERQRVGIARAIVKNPAIVIADEPTGNLDSRNTLEIMNIIKAISEDKLVILVTHEEKLANFYASRIIRILDGKVISDEKNKHVGSLDYKIENKVYLKDIKDHKNLTTDNYNVDFYNANNGKLDIDIVINNGNIYIRTNNSNDRIEVVDEGSSIELINDNYRQLTKEETMANAFDLSKLEPVGKRKYKSILNPITLIKRGFKSVANYHIMKKVLLIGFLVSAMFITYALSNIFGVLNITDDEFVTADKSYITTMGKNTDISEYLNYETDDRFDYVMPGDSVLELSMPYSEHYQTKDSAAMLKGSLSDAGKLKPSDIMKGNLPQNDNEVVIDKMVLKKAIDNGDARFAGYAKPNAFIGGVIKVANMPDLTIVGISDKSSPCIYASRNIFVNLLANAQVSKGEAGGAGDDSQASSTGYIDYMLMSGKVSLKKGSWPVRDYEVVVNEKNKDEMTVGKQISNKINGTKLKVVGYYTDKNDSDFMLVNNSTIKYNLIRNTANITMCPMDKQSALNDFKENDISVKDLYAQSRKEYMADQSQSIRASILLAAIVLLISFIEIYLMMRASFISRIKEVGVYRAIGVKKGDIYKMFMGEILAITTIASMPGFLFMTYILHKISEISYFEDTFMVNSMIMGLCVVLIYGFNLLFGLLPVFKTMRKTPAAILSRTDIN